MITKHRFKNSKGYNCCFFTDSNYWDCECDKNYIHSKEEQQCKRCGVKQEDAPDSRTDEIKGGDLKDGK